MNLNPHSSPMLIALVLWALPAFAQEDAVTTPQSEPVAVPATLAERYQKMAEQLQQPLAKRDIQIVAGEVQTVSRKGILPSILDQHKFMAVFSIQPQGFDSKKEAVAIQHYERLQLDGQSLQKYPQELDRLLKIDGVRIIHGQWEGFARRRNGDETEPKEKELVQTRFQQLAGLCPRELLPDQKVVDFLSSEVSNRDVYQFVKSTQYKLPSGNPAIQAQLTVTVFALTAAEAEERARAIIQLYDGGLSRPMQQYLLEQGKKSLQFAAPEHDKVKQLEDQWKAEREKLAKPSEISPDILSQLKAQKVMVAVELAGLSARVKACDAMLTEPRKLEISTLQSISDMKVKAEIERVGIKEKLDQINLFIAEGDTREKARERMTALANEMSEVRQKIFNYERSASQYASLFDLYAPFAVVDNQIKISPIEWTP
jgi:hypothetical protein